MTRAVNRNRHHRKERNLTDSRSYASSPSPRSNLTRLRCFQEMKTVVSSLRSQPSLRWLNLKQSLTALKTIHLQEIFLQECLQLLIQHQRLHQSRKRSNLLSRLSSHLQSHPQSQSNHKKKKRRKRLPSRPRSTTVDSQSKLNNFLAKRLLTSRNKRARTFRSKKRRMTLKMMRAPSRVCCLGMRHHNLQIRSYRQSFTRGQQAI